MNKFPEELNEPSKHRITIDKTRVLLAVKKSYELDELQNLIQRTEFELESDMRKSNEIDYEGPLELINHTDKRYWLLTREGNPINEINLNRLREVFMEQLDWIGPIYQNPDLTGRKGLFCPIPNILVIKFTSDINYKDGEYSKKLVRYNMKEIPEKSKYLNEYHYFIIKNIENANAYQIKDLLLNDTQFVSEVLFESMPMILPTSVIPNDTNIADQWNVTRIQAGGPGITAWNFTTGNNDMVICIIDSGCDLTHPDLQFSSPGVHLDNNLADGSPINPPTASNTNAGHGTACAGIAAAIINNAQGVAGIAGSCKIMPLAFRNWDNNELARGINYASNNGAHVISMSVNFSVLTVQQRVVVESAIQNAFSNNIVMCAATGNANINSINYPASNPLIIACGASDQVDNRKSPTSPDGENWGSNRGPQISVVAPGVRIPTTDRQGATGYNPATPPIAGEYPDTNYMRFFRGTSAATPHVAGLAALIRSLYPTLTNTQVRDIIELNAQKVGTVPYTNTAGHPNGTWNTDMGYGRINARNAAFDINNLWINWNQLDNLRTMNVFRPNTKLSFGYTSSDSPSIAVLNGSFWMAWRGEDEDKLHIVDIFNGGSLITLDEFSEHSPSIVSSGSSLWIAWTGIDNDKLNVMDVFNPSSKVVLNEKSESSPSIALLFTGLWIAWRGYNNDKLNVMDVFNPSSKLVLNEKSDTFPSITGRGGRLWIAWKGAGNENLNVMNVLDPSSKRVLDELSTHSPSIVTFKNSIWIAWKGSNLALNVMDVFNGSTKIVLSDGSDIAPSIDCFTPPPPR